MMIDTATNAALKGLADAQARFDRHAVQVANFGNGPNNTDLAGPIVGITLDSIQYQASLTVLKAQDEDQRALLDIRA
jgi:hypothetical protein